MDCFKTRSARCRGFSVATCALWLLAAATASIASEEQGAAKARGRLDLAEAALTRGRWHTALREGRAALEAALDADEPGLQARAWERIGDACFYLRSYDCTIEAADVALQLYTRLADVYGQAMALKNHAIACRNLGQYDQALVYFQAAQQRYEQLRPSPGDISILHNLAALYVRLGASGLALRTLERALEIARAGTDSRQIVTAEVALAARLSEAGLESAALEHLHQALSLAESDSTLEPPGMPVELNLRVRMQEELAWAMYGLGRIDEASEALRTALHLARSQEAENAAPRLVRLLVRQARLVVATDLDETRSLLDEAAELASSSGASETWLVQSAQADLLRAEGDGEGAIGAYEEAAATLEALGATVFAREDRRDLRESAQGLYRRWLLALLERGRAGDAAQMFEIVERARARTLVEDLAARDADGKNPLPDSARARESELRDGITALERELAAKERGLVEAKELQTRLEETELALDQLYAAQRLLAAPRAVRVSARPVGLSEAQGLLSASTGLVQYVLAEDRVMAIVLTASDVRAIGLPVRAKELEARVGFYHRMLVQELDGWETASRRLYGELVAPLRLDASLRNLIVVPDGALHALPFETLLEPAETPDMPGCFLAERWRISYAPSATVLAGLRLRRQPLEAAPNADLLVLADSVEAAPEPAAAGQPMGLRSVYAEEGMPTGPLPFAALEARSVAAWGGPGSELLLGARASESRLKKMNLERYRILHFVTHGLLRPDAPAYSALSLHASQEDAEDGFLEAREIVRLRLQCEMVVLSACSTAQGRILQGDGAQSLALAFLEAGARSVVASLWSVEDETTASLMTRFYGHLAEGLPRAEALSRAKLESAREATSVSPRRWAPFVLLGEADAPLRLQGRPWLDGWLWLWAPAFLLAFAAARSHWQRRAKRHARSASHARKSGPGQPQVPSP